MIVPSLCNHQELVGVMDYAYLSLNVYHDPKDDKILGHRPWRAGDFHTLNLAIDRDLKGWGHLNFKNLQRPHASGFYAEFYVKVYQQKIHHVMVAFRGTDNWGDDKEDFKTWHDSVLFGAGTALHQMDYWQQIVPFILQVQDVLIELDHQHLLAPKCSYHVTGHSLGGALANMVAGACVQCAPPVSMTKSRIPPIPQVISFNAPGIGAMPLRCSSGYCEGQVVSMRSSYDVVSAIGKPYGYVINNAIEQGYEAGKINFALSDVRKTINKIFDKLEKVPNDQIMNYRSQAALNSVLFASEAPAAGLSVMKQHSMHNFILALAKHPSSMSATFDHLTLWANKHGKLNHDEKAPPLYGLTG